MKLITTLRMCALGSILLYIVHDSTVTAASTIVGFQTDVVRISSGNGATDSLVNTTNEAISIFNAAAGLADGSTGAVTSGSTTYNVVQVVRDLGIATINYGGTTGGFGNNNPFPDGLVNSSSDYVVTARACVVIPAGTWQIALGSDDGGFLTLPGVTFNNEINENGGTAGDDTLFFNSPRAHNWTLATFTTTTPLVTQLSALMFERGGAESFEIAIRDASAGSLNSVTNTDWSLLQDGQDGWSVTQVPEPSTSVFLLLATSLFFRRQR